MRHINAEQTFQENRTKARPHRHRPDRLLEREIPDPTGSMKQQRKILFTAFIIVIVAFLCSCGEPADRDYFYSVSIVNNTDSTITVRYNWGVDIISYEWLSDTTISPGNNEIIEWYSWKLEGEQIEVEYQGKKKLYTVPQLVTITVTVQDFQN